MEVTMMERGTVLQKGETAPDFVLKDQNGKEFRLSDLRGRRVLLSLSYASLDRRMC